MKYTSVNVHQLKNRKGKPWQARAKYKDVDGTWKSISKMLTDALSETVRFSDPMSNPSLENTEKTISDKVSMLRTADEMDMEALITDINMLVNDRNRKCKILK